ncbi:hypothetical protein ACFL96_00520 [Thermoproteota archaeon]
MDLSAIEDKMRLFLQREGKFDRAIISGINSYLYWAIGLKKQNRKGELAEYIEEDNIRRFLEKLTKKSGKAQYINDCLEIIVNASSALPDVDVRGVDQEISNILAQKSS